MGRIAPHPVEPKRADPETIDWARTVFEYDLDTDTLALHLFGPPRPAKVLHTRGLADLLIDPTTQLIVGYQIEGYLTHAVHRDPSLLTYAEYAGIAPAVVAAVRQRIEREGKRALATAFEQAALRGA